MLSQLCQTAVFCTIHWSAAGPVDVFSLSASSENVSAKTVIFLSLSHCEDLIWFCLWFLSLPFLPRLLISSHGRSLQINWKPMSDCFCSFLCCQHGQSSALLWYFILLMVSIDTFWDNMQYVYSSVWLEACHFNFLWY